MTKEQIFDKYSHVTTNELGNLAGPDYMDSNDFYMAADEYAEQESCLFAEWAAMNGWYFNKIQRWSNKGETSDNLIEVLTSTKSTTELYQLFKSQKQ